MADVTNYGIWLYGSHQKACGAWTGVKAQRFGVRFVVWLEYSAREYQATLGLIRESTDIKGWRLLSQSWRSLGCRTEHGERPSHWVEFDINEMKHIMTGLDCVGCEHSASIRRT